MRGAAWGLVLLGAAGCTLHAVDPHLRPDVELPPAWPSLPAASQVATTAADVEPWWHAFGDAHLDAVVREALAGAFDVEVAFARLSAARARASQAGAPLRPAVDAVASRSASNAGVPSAGDLDDGALDVAEAGLVAVWELDLFGRLSAGRASALADAEAAAEDLAAVRLSLSAAVTDTWLLALEQRLLLQLLADQLALDHTLLELTELRFAQGAASAVDMLQQHGQVADTESLIPPARAVRRAAENRLDVLLGRAPDGEDRVTAAAFPALPPLPDAGVPADLLLRRPDLRARLADLAARDHEVAAAVADRFPRLVLSGSLGGEDVDGSAGWAGALAAGLVGPLTDGGLRRAVVDERRAALDESLAALGGALVVAVEEVDGALWIEQRRREELEVLQRRERILRSNVVEARNRYANGLTDYLPVLVAVNGVQEVQRDVLARTRGLLAQRVALHRALGGALPPGEQVGAPPP